MGKGRIIKEIEDGWYLIELDQGEAERGAQLALINELLTGEELALLSASAAVSSAESYLDVKSANLNRLINELNNQPEPSEDDGPVEIDPEQVPIADRINGAVVEVERASLAVLQAARRRSQLVMKIAELKAKRSELEGLEAAVTVEAWCTDGESEMTGEVGTVEVPGEPVGPILIKPGFEGGASFNPAADGRLIQRALMSSAQAYLNAALLPGWQKWRPTYRFGTITALDHAANVCSVELEPERSSAQGLDITPEALVSDVPIEYRECNAAAFELGDSVLIEYRGQLAENPVVIGFKSNPRYCEPYIVISYTAHNSALDQSWCNYLTWDNRTESVVTEHAQLFDPDSALRIRSAVIPRGNELLFSSSQFFSTGGTELDVLTVASTGESGYRITENGADVDIIDTSLVSDGLRLYALSFDGSYILQIGEAYVVTKKIPTPLIGGTLALSEPHKDFIACAGYDGESYPFVALYRISTGEQLYYSTFGAAFGYISGPYVGLSSRGICVCDFDGVLHIHQPSNWDEPGEGWVKYNLGRLTYYPEGIVMTDDYLFINQRLPGGVFNFRRYSFLDAHWADYGDLAPAEIGRRVTGFMTASKKAL